jgi:type II secretory pathway pseudopilin PulG
MKFKRNRKSFTLIETIAATLLLGLSVVVLTGISVNSLRTARSITMDEQAWDLADRQLTMVDFIGVGNYLLSGPTEGTFEGDGATFGWTLGISETSLDFLYDVTVTVRWMQQQRHKQIEAQTRLSGHE